MSDTDDEADDVGGLSDEEYPYVRQFSIFSPNRVGQLLRLIRLIEEAKLRVCALSISDSSDCAINRLVVTQPERAIEILSAEGYEFCEVELLVVELPSHPQPVVSICSSLLEVEINIHYAFPLLVRPYGRSALAFYVDNIPAAAKILDSKGFILLSENDLS